MINTLFRTKFESNITFFIVFLALNAFLCFMVLAIGTSAHTPDSPHVGLNREAFIWTTTWLLIFSLVAGGGALMRQNREKRCRLYAQLPVSPREVRLAYWCLAALFIFISTCLLTLIMYYAGITPAATIVRFALLYFFHAGALLALISIVISNNMRIIPEEIRRRTIIYFFMSALLVFLILFCMGWVVAGYAYLAEGNRVNWTLLNFLMMLACAGLVMFDVYLFRRKENYLG